jgi:antitoxin component of RelBE/YafQ-DinJ toxin-antitoxin module
MENNEEQKIDMNERIRITARISRKTRALAKAIYPVMGVTFEQRIEFLLAKDLAKEMNKNWFKKMINRETNE